MLNLPCLISLSDQPLTEFNNNVVICAAGPGAVWRVEPKGDQVDPNTPYMITYIGPSTKGGVLTLETKDADDEKVWTNIVLCKEEVDPPSKRQLWTLGEEFCRPQFVIPSYLNPLEVAAN